MPADILERFVATLLRRHADLDAAFESFLPVLPESAFRETLEKSGIELVEAKSIFSLLDVDRDGFVGKNEFMNVMGGLARQTKHHSQKTEKEEPRNGTRSSVGFAEPQPAEQPSAPPVWQQFEKGALVSKYEDALKELYDENADAPLTTRLMNRIQCMENEVVIYVFSNFYSNLWLILGKL